MADNDNNGREPVTLAINKNIYQKFKDTCSLRGFRPNILVEQFMADVIDIDKRKAKEA